MSDEAIQKEFFTYRIKDSYFEQKSLGDAVHSMTAFYIDKKIHTVEDLIAQIHDKIVVYKNSREEVPWDNVKPVPQPKPCNCFGCRLTRWFKQRTKNDHS